MEFRPELVELAKVIKEVRDVLRGVAAGKRIKLEVQIDPLLSSVILDPARLKQVLYNSLSNVIKFTADDGHVTIRVRPEGPYFFRIEVQDTGIGIRAEDLNLLFVEFQQLDTSSAKKYQARAWASH